MSVLVPTVASPAMTPPGRTSVTEIRPSAGQTRSRIVLPAKSNQPNATCAAVEPARESESRERARRSDEARHLGNLESVRQDTRKRAIAYRFTLGSVMTGNSGNRHRKNKQSHSYPNHRDRAHIP
jgi:hypothetical protein